MYVTVQVSMVHGVEKGRRAKDETFFPQPVSCIRSFSDPPLWATLRTWWVQWKVQNSCAIKRKIAHGHCAQTQSRNNANWVKVHGEPVAQGPKGSGLCHTWQLQYLQEASVYLIHCKLTDSNLFLCSTSCLRTICQWFWPFDLVMHLEFLQNAALV